MRYGQEPLFSETFILPSPVPHVYQTFLKVDKNYNNTISIHTCAMSMNNYCTRLLYRILEKLLNTIGHIKNYN